MNLPLAPQGLLGPGWDLAVAVLIGIGFGFTLERGGFGSSRRLAAQFYLYDMTVFKVMFTAIVTAMLGLFGCARLGLVDLSLVWINPTYLWPQLVGGFLLGVGFIISGYCPGTAIVASASGKIDGVLALAGVAAGALVYGIAAPPALLAFEEAGAQGRVLLSDLLGIAPGWLALGVAAMAGLAFLGAEAVERRFADRAERGRAPFRQPRRRNAVLAALLGTGILLAASPAAAPPAPAARPLTATIEPIDLARILAEGTGDHRVVDLRSAEAFGEGSLPGALWVEDGGLRLDAGGRPLDAGAQPLGAGVLRLDAGGVMAGSRWAENLPVGPIYVLVTEGGSGNYEAGTVASEASGSANNASDWGLTVPAGYRAVLLRGGYAAWHAEILTEPRAASTQVEREAERALHLERVALYTYFTGAAAARPAVAAPPPVVSPGAKRKKAGGC